MDDLIAFLNKRLDEREAAARAATPGPWSFNPGKQWLHGDHFVNYDLAKGEEFVAFGGPHPFTGCVAATGPADHPQSMSDAAFIAQNDPVHVLREIEAGRRLLALHSPVWIEPGHELFNDAHLTSDPMRICKSCSPETMWRREKSWPCRTLRVLALPYADREGYLEEWKL